MSAGGQAVALVEDAPGKLTLSLRVTGRRPDGYHELDLTVAFTALGDRLTLLRPGEGRLRTEGPLAGDLGASAHDNLVLRAARALADAAGRPIDVDFVLTKNLPVAAGLGGGSADAAACLRALSRHWGLDREAVDMTDIALRLGADVPICLASQPSRATGIGEVVTPLVAGRLAGRALVLVNPRVPLATPEVFGAWRALGRSFSVPSDDPLDPRSWRNDLAPAAMDRTPIVGSELESLARQDGAWHVSVAGSGPTCFALMDSEESAVRAAKAIMRAHPGWWVRADRLRR